MPIGVVHFLKVVQVKKHKAVFPVTLRLNLLQVRLECPAVFHHGQPIHLGFLPDGLHLLPCSNQPGRILQELENMYQDESQAAEPGESRLVYAGMAEIIPDVCKDTSCGQQDAKGIQECLLFVCYELAAPFDKQEDAIAQRCPGA